MLTKGKKSSLQDHESSRANLNSFLPVKWCVVTIPFFCGTRKATPSGVDIASNLRKSVGIPQMEAEVAAPHWQRSYWDHDTQNCGAAGTGRDDSDDDSSSVEFRLQRP